MEIESAGEFCNTLEGIVGNNWPEEFPKWAEIYKARQTAIESRDALIRADTEAKWLEQFNTTLRLISNTATDKDIDLYRRDPVLHASVAAIHLAITQGQPDPRDSLIEQMGNAPAFTEALAAWEATK